MLTNIFVRCERFYECELIIGGDFNVNLDGCDSVANCVNKFLMDHLLIRCDSIFPSRKSVTYVNEALGHESCIDYLLVSNNHDVMIMQSWTRM